MNRAIGAIGAIVLVFLAGCDQPNEKIGLSWAKAPGGGTVAFSDPAAEAKFAVRCIPTGAIENCLVVNEIDGTSMTFQVVQRKDVDETDLWANKDGYQCSFNLGLAISQSVMKDGATLISASAPYIGNAKLPSRADTEEFIKLNVPNPKAGYFDCARVADIFSKGSLATAGTSAVTAGMLF